MDNTMLPAESQKGKKITMVVIVVVMVGLVGLVAYNFIAKQKTNGPAETNEQNNVSQDGFPTTFYSYVGTIKSLVGNKIEVEALASNNYLKNDETIVVLTNGETVFLEQDKNIDINQIEPGTS
ncbi:MAG TPA: hypothetical protein P5267_01725, partial [Patescibacteria group bacterium]|nr:hypothetical protein [Patescibacteria group bacterium]